MERKLTGIPASPGIAVGPIRLLRWEIPEVRHRIVADDAVPAELERLHDAIGRAKQRLTQIKKRVEKSAGTGTHAPAAHAHPNLSICLAMSKSL